MRVYLYANIYGTLKLINKNQYIFVITKQNPYQTLNPEPRPGPLSDF